MARILTIVIFLLPTLGSYVITPLNGFKAIRTCKTFDEAKEPECARFCITKERPEFNRSVAASIRVLARLFRYEIVSYDKNSETLSWNTKGVQESLKNSLDNVTVTAYHWKHAKEGRLELTESGRPIMSCCGVPLTKNHCKVAFDHPGELFVSMTLNKLRLGAEVSAYRYVYYRYETICPEIKPSDKEVACIVLDKKTGAIKQKTMIVGFANTGGQDSRFQTEVEMCSFSLSAEIAKHGIGVKRLDGIFGKKLVDATDYLQTQEQICPTCNCTKEKFSPGNPTTFKPKDQAKCFHFVTEEILKPKVYCLLPPEVRAETIGDQYQSHTEYKQDYTIPCLIGGLALVFMALLAVVCWRRHAKRKRKEKKQRWSETNEKPDVNEDIALITTMHRRNETL